MTYELSRKSRDKLKGVHPDLIKVIETAITDAPVPFVIVEGLRSLDRQKQLVAKGASRTLNSRHLTGHAVDIAPLVDGEVRWDWPLYDKLGPHIENIVALLNIPIEWGGRWAKFPDGPHFELDRKTYH